MIVNLSLVEDERVNVRQGHGQVQLRSFYRFGYRQVRLRHLSWTNFYNGLTWQRVHGIHDAVDNKLVS